MNNKVKFLRGTSDEYAGAVKDDDTFYYTTDDEKFYVGSKEITGGGVTVDSKLSDTSINPVQNKVIKASLDDKADKTTATTTTDGLMSASDKTKLDNADNTYALKSKYGDTMINVGRKAGTIVGEYSTAEGRNTTASGYASHAEGSNAGLTLKGEITFYSPKTVTISDDVIIEVDSSQAYGLNSHAEGCQTLAYGNSSHAEGSGTVASGSFSHAEGSGTVASGSRSHTEGIWTIASGASCHAEGKETTANGNNSCHAEGSKTTANGIASHAEGSSSNKATDLIPDLSWQTTTDEEIINAWNTQQFSLAHGGASHVEGSDNLALGHESHAEGSDTVAVGNHSHTSGYHTQALHENEAAYGRYNISNSDTLFSIGDGTADDARHNAFEITTTGGKLHDKDIATTDLIPTSLPANGGNADTLNGMSAETIRSMSKNVESGTSVSSQLADGTYCGVWSDAPSGLTDTQGTLIVSNYNTNGAPSPWSHRTFYSPHYNIIWHGFTANGTWYGWKEISTTPIKSTTVNGSTDGYGSLLLWPISGSIPIAAVGDENRIFSPFIGSGNNYYLAVRDLAGNAVKNTTASATVVFI